MLFSHPVATSAIDSQPDLNSSFEEESKRPNNTSTTILSSSPGQNSSPRRPPYSPGMRSLGSPKKTTAEEAVTAGEIQMQSFADGAPPPSSRVPFVEKDRPMAGK
jgi:hypothetical protein